MAGETKGQPIGEARIDVRANVQQAVKDIKEGAPAVKQATEQAFKGADYSKSLREEMNQLRQTPDPSSPAPEQATKKIKGLGSSLKEATKPLREFVSGFTTLLGTFAAVTAIGAGVVATFISIGKAINAKGEQVKKARLELKEYLATIAELKAAGSALPKVDIDPDATDIKKSIDERGNLLYEAYNKAIGAADKAGNRKLGASLLEEFRAADTALNKEREEALKRLANKQKLEQNAVIAEEKQARLLALKEYQEKMKEIAEDNRKAYADIMSDIRRQQDEMFRAADELRRESSRAFQDALSQSLGNFTTEFTTSLAGIESQVFQIVQKLDRTAR